MMLDVTTSRQPGIFDLDLALNTIQGLEAEMK